MKGYALAMSEFNHAHAEPDRLAVVSETLDALLKESKAYIREQTPSRQPFQRLVQPQQEPSPPEGELPANVVVGRPWLEASRTQVEELVAGSSLWQQASPQHQQAIGAALSHSMVPSAFQDAPTVEQASDPEADDYLLKTTRLIAKRLAEYLEHERLVHHSLEHQRILAEHRALSLHMKHVLEENKRLNDALQQAQNTIQQLQKKKRLF